MPASILAVALALTCLAPAFALRAEPIGPIAAKTATARRTQQVPTTRLKGTFADGAGEILVIVEGMRGREGSLRVALWQQAEGFPEVAEGAAAGMRVPLSAGKRPLAMFTNIPAGPVAIVIHHDADDDGEVDTNLFGIPSEGIGFSKDAPLAFGPPEFSAARMQLDAGQQLQLRIRMRY